MLSRCLLYGFEQAEDPGGRVVVREASSVSLMHLRQLSSSASRCLAALHVVVRVKPLAGRAIAMPPKALGCFGIEPPLVFGIVQDQPQFEARVGDRDADAVVPRHLNSIKKAQMRRRRLDVEDAPILGSGLTGTRL